MKDVHANISHSNQLGKKTNILFELMLGPNVVDLAQILPNCIDFLINFWMIIFTVFIRASTLN